MSDKWSKLNKKCDDLFLKHKFEKNPYVRELIREEIERTLEEMKKCLNGGDLNWI